MKTPFYCYLVSFVLADVSGNRIAYGDSFLKVTTPISNKESFNNLKDFVFKETVKKNSGLLLDRNKLSILNICLLDTGVTDASESEGWEQFPVL